MSRRRFAAMSMASLLASSVPALAATACGAQSGERRAAGLVRHCRDVVQDPRACSAARPCAALQEEIRRGCRLAGDDAPNLCGAYDDEGDDEEDD